MDPYICVHICVLCTNFLVIFVLRTTSILFSALSIFILHFDEIEKFHFGIFTLWRTSSSSSFVFLFFAIIVVKHGDVQFPNMDPFCSTVECYCCCSFTPFLLNLFCNVFFPLNLYTMCTISHSMCMNVYQFEFAIESIYLEIYFIVIVSILLSLTLCLSLFLCSLFLSSFLPFHLN